MTGYTLTYKHVSPAPIDGSVLRPDTLGALNRDELEKQTLRIGNTNVPLAELFNISGSASETLTITDPPLLDNVGAKMQAGNLIINGDVGDNLGASMRGGRIIVTGNAGNRVGGPSADEDRGMRGGEIQIAKNAGNEVGYLMRRGVIAVSGTCADRPGYRMLAGTIAIAKGALQCPGLELQRGTIVSFDPDAKHDLGERWAQDGIFDTQSLTAIGLVKRQLAALGWDIKSAADAARFATYTGDRFELNKGELWLATLA